MSRAQEMEGLPSAEREYAQDVLRWPHLKHPAVRRAQGLPSKRRNMGGWMARVVGWDEPMGALLYQLPRIPWEPGTAGRPALFDASSVEPGNILLTYGYELTWKPEYRVYLVLDINDEDMIVQEVAMADAIAALRGKGEDGR